MGVQEPVKSSSGAAVAVLAALSVSHLLNDTVQSLIVGRSITGYSAFA